MYSNIKAARILGWTSLAVGVAELVATRPLQDALGVKRHKTLIRSFGLREIAAGVTILSQPGLNRGLSAGLWSRVAGDALDLAALAKAKESTRNPTGVAAVSSVVAAITGLDLLVAFLTQRDLHRSHKASRAARHRVRPVPAVPNPGNGHRTSASAGNHHNTPQGAGAS